jgi:hypothetical protein
MRNSSNFSGMEEHYQNILDPLVRKTMKMKLPWPVLIAAYQSAQSDRKKELTCGMFVISYDYHYKDTATIDWTVCSLISNNQKINLVGVTERTVRIMWTGDHIGDPFDKDIVSPMYLPLETSMDVDMSILRYAQAQISAVETIKSESISFAEILEVESTKTPCSDSKNMQQCKNNQIANELWHRVEGLFHSNVSAPVVPINAIESQRPCVCIDPALSNCISFPGYMKGQTKNLIFEIVSGNYAAIVSSDNNLFATPNAPGESLIVYGSNYQDIHLRQAIWIDSSIFYGRSSFKVGERVDLRGFHNVENRGIFEIKQVIQNVKDNSTKYKSGTTSTTNGVLIVLNNISPSSAEPGYVNHLQYEANKMGGIVTGCFGKTAGPATSGDPIIVYGGSRSSSGISKYLIRFSPIYMVSKYEVGELVRLQHFKLLGNNGVFRISAVQNNVLELAEIKSCAATNIVCSGTIDHLIKVSKLARKRDMRIRDKYRCPKNCNKHGRMEDDGCSCDEGFDSNTCCKTRLPKNSVSITEDIHCPTAIPTEICSGHGECNTITGVCGCDNSWMASDCNIPVLPCPNACSSHGVCETSSGLCHCDDSWSGIDCAISSLFCPTNCCGPTHGICNHNTGRCVCHSGYSGMDCCSASLPCCQGCSKHGTCDGTNGQCTCDDGWGGNYKECCTKKLCPKDCHSDEKHGICSNGICKCQPSFTGVACETSVLPCPNGCSGHGTCDGGTGECSCQVSWRGIDCGIPYLPCNCSIIKNTRTISNTKNATNVPIYNATLKRIIAAFGNIDNYEIIDATVENTVGGTCDTTTGIMKCKNHTFVGKCCTRIPCFNNCTSSLHGKCDTATLLCICSRAWMGADCSVPKCGQHGILLSDGSCRADKHYYSPIQGGICDRVGPLCRPDIRCVADTSSGDTCSKNAVGCSHVGACMCKMGWTGVTCGNRLEPTGEQNLKNYKQNNPAAVQADNEMSLHKSAYLIYSEARFPIHQISPSVEDFQVVFNLLGYSSKSQLEILSDSKLIIRKGDINGDMKIQFNEFIKLCLIREHPFIDLIPNAILYVFRMLDYDSDATLSFSDMAMSIARSLAIQKWNSIVARDVGGKLKDNTNREESKTTISLGMGTILQGSRRCKMETNPCNIVSPGDWLSIAGRDFDVYEVTYNASLNFTLIIVLV